MAGATGTLRPGTFKLAYKHDEKAFDETYMPDRARAARADVAELIKGDNSISAARPKWNISSEVAHLGKYNKTSADFLLSTTHGVAGTPKDGEESAAQLGALHTIMFDKPELPGGWNASQKVEQKDVEAFHTRNLDMAATNAKRMAATGMLATYVSPEASVTAATELMRATKRSGTVAKVPTTFVPRSKSRTTPADVADVAALEDWEPGL